MRIISLKSENIKCLKCVEIAPSGNEIILTGSNGAGKSSILDAIFYGLTGKKPKDPIRHGEEKASIEINLGRITVKRVFTKKGTRLEVWNEEGAKFASPQNLLDQILGELSFDPLAFQKMKEKAQRDLMVQLSGLNFDESEKKREELYAQRTFQNRTLRDLEGEINRMGKPEDGLPNNEVYISECLDMLNVLNENAQYYEEEKARLQDIKDGKAGLLDEIEGLKRSRALINQKINQTIDDISAASQEIENFVLPVEVKPEELEVAQKKIESAEQTNIKIREAASYRKAMEGLVVKKSEVEKVTQKIDEIDQEKAEAIKAAVYPVKGLSVDDKAVFFDGVPFSQASTGQQIGISTQIAMSLNPKLKIILIRDGSLLDKEAFEAISKAAKYNDYQLWLERLDETGKVGFYIEDGEVVAVNGVALEEKNELSAV